MSEAPASSTSKAGLLVFAGGILIGSAVAAAVAYAYTSAYQDDRPRSRRGKGNQRYCVNLASRICTEAQHLYDGISALGDVLNGRHQCYCRPSSPRRRRINYGENGDYTHYNGNHTPYEQKEKKRPDGVTAHNKPAQSESGRFQVRHHTAPLNFCFQLYTQVFCVISELP